MPVETNLPATAGGGGDETVVRLKRRVAELKKVRQPYEPRFQEVIDYVMPGRLGFIEAGSPSSEAGRVMGDKIFDGTAPNALEVWAVGNAGYSCSPITDWQKIVLEPGQLMDIEGSRQWLQDDEDGIYSALSRSNFYSAIVEYLRNLGGLGIAIMYVEESEDGSKANYCVRHLRECFISENESKTVDTLYRLFWLTARNAVEMFGKETMSDAIKRAAGADGQPAENPDQEFEFLHAIEPRKKRENGKVDKLNKKFAAYYLELGAGQKVCLEEGYDKFPYFVSRLGDGLYGRSPALTMMSDIKTLNLMMKDYLDAGALSLMPPVTAPMSMRGSVKLTLRGMNYTRSPNEHIEPIKFGENFPVMEKLMERKQQDIQKGYRVDFFLMMEALAHGSMSPFEITQRMGEKAALLGAEMGAFNSDTLAAVIDWNFQHEMDAGRLPLPPAELAQAISQINGQYKIRFVGPLAQAQMRYHQTLGNMQAFQSVVPLAVAAKEFGLPNPLENFDLDILGVDQAEAGGMVQKAIRDPDVVRKERIEKAAQQAEMLKLQLAAAAAKLYPGTTKAPEPGSPAEAMGKKNYQVTRDSQGRVSGIQGE